MSAITILSIQPPPSKSCCLSLPIARGAKARKVAFSLGKQGETALQRPREGWHYKPAVGTFLAKILLT